MIQTEGRIVTDIYKFIRQSALAEAVSGNIYKSINRPPNSKEEDIVIKPLSNMPRQRQECVVNVNIYIPDQLDDGQYDKNGARCDELEEVAAQVLEVFHLETARVILDTQHTYQVPEANAHVINNRLLYTIVNE